MARTITVSTRNRGLARLSSGAATGITSLPARDIQALFDPEGGLLEGNGEIVSEIRTFCRPLLPRTAKAAEKVLEQVLEDVGKRGATAEATEAACPGGPKAFNAAVTVVMGALIGVTQTCVGLVDLLELLFRCLFTLVTVGMELQGELPVCFFKLFWRGFTGNSKDLIIIGHLSNQTFTLVVGIQQSLFYNK